MERGKSNGHHHRDTRPPFGGGPGGGGLFNVPSMSKFNFNTKPSQNFKLRNRIDIGELQKAGVQPICGNTSNGGPSSRDEVSSIGQLTEPKLHKTANNGGNPYPMQPLKPLRLSEDDIYEYEYTTYLQEQLLNSIVEEEESIAKDIVADDGIIAAIRDHFSQKELGMTEAKDQVIYKRIHDIEICDCLFNCLATIIQHFNTGTNLTISQITARLSQAVDVLPITNAKYISEEQAIDWKQLESVAKRLAGLLVSPDKPFHLVKMLKQSVENVKTQLEQMETKRTQKQIVHQKLTFLTSLKLCAQLYEKNQLLRVKDDNFSLNSASVIIEETTDDDVKGIDGESTLHMDANLGRSDSRN